MIYIVEDDRNIQEIEIFALKNSGYQAVGFETAKEFYGALSEKLPELILLDIMLPDEDGLSILKRLRTRADTQKIPVILVTAKSTEIDKVKGLDGGADDYIAKPFNALEIVARVKAHLRRSDRSRTAVYSAGGLTLNPETCTVTKDGEPVLLTPTEYKLLSVLMRSPGRIFTRVQLSEAINGEYYENDDNTMMVHISKLREKIEDNPRKPARLVTVRGLGYRFEK